ncbi:hypothetical protein BpHYR1_002013 [Brachionus plicatilis]|uniref:Uncharacterized protein n=1 Tax=Brachionus plicatilis TaxID=10195 RepID=A0A3M7T4A6_BRAPC|nr:hypothetical protein BpHYR1_002013 [Brachionus plicatilis]
MSDQLFPPNYSKQTNIIHLKSFISYYIKIGHSNSKNNLALSQSTLNSLSIRNRCANSLVIFLKLVSLINYDKFNRIIKFNIKFAKKKKKVLLQNQPKG